jgi:puromycin-sensitive aminopeptidase
MFDLIFVTSDTMGAALRLDSLRSSHPIQVPIKHAEEVEQVFDAISYCKGSSVVRMAEGVLGDDLFREGLRLYMKTHAYGNTRTDDLWAAWSKVSGIDVGALMASWTNQMGYPYLKVVGEVWGEGSVEITLEQGWFLSDGSTTEADASKTWRIPLLFTTSKYLSL